MISFNPFLDFSLLFLSDIFKHKTFRISAWESFFLFLLRFLKRHLLLFENRWSFSLAVIVLFLLNELFQIDNLFRPLQREFLFFFSLNFDVLLSFWFHSVGQFEIIASVYIFSGNFLTAPFTNDNVFMLETIGVVSTITELAE